MLIELTSHREKNCCMSSNMQHDMAAFITAVPDLDNKEEIIQFLNKQHFSLNSLKEFVAKHPNEFFAFPFSKQSLHVLENALLAQKTSSMAKSTSLQSMISITSQESSFSNDEFVTTATEYSLTHIIEPSLLGKECTLRLGIITSILSC